MKYAIFHKSLEGEIGERRDDPDNPEKPLTFDQHETATIWLVEAARKKKFPLQMHAYSVECCDEEGNLVDELSKDEATKAAESATHIMDEHEDVRQAMATMIAGRQMYVMGVVELEKAADKLEESPHPMAVDVLTQTASNAASEPFDETVLFQGLVETVLPWMKKITGEHAREEIDTRRTEAAEEEEQRRKVHVPIGITLDVDEEPVLTRGRNVIFVGYGPAVKIILDHIVTNVMAARDEDHPRNVFSVIRLVDKATREDAHRQLSRLGKKDWENCTKTNKTFEKLVIAKLYEQMSAMPDLLVCDDMPYAYEGLLGAPEAMRANEALRKFSTWSKEMGGCAFIGAIPLDAEETPLMTGSQWERLRAHAVIRPITVTREDEDLEEGQCRITVGRDAFSLTVDEKLLSSGKIILP